MKLRLHALLFAALMSCAISAWAESKPPVPKTAPARVPFTAFRIKPILDPHLNDKTKSMVEPLKTPKLTIHPLVVKKLAKPPVPPKEKQKEQRPETRQAVKENTKESDEEILSAAFINGVPVPAYKPVGDMEDVAMAMPTSENPDHVLRVPGENLRPSEVDVITPENDAAYSPPGPIVEIRPVEDDTNMRIRDRRRFSSDERTAGLRREPVRISSLGLPRDMRNLTLGSKEQGDMVSPVLLPGHTTIVAAPDYQQVSQSGLPNDVVVFFQENSRDMEVGQLDVVNNDVLSALAQDPDLKLQINGYSENIGPDTERMAQTRASVIRDYLIKQHISSNRLTARGKGDDTGVEPRDRVDMTFSR